MKKAKELGGFKLVVTYSPGIFIGDPEFFQLPAEYLKNGAYIFFSCCLTNKAVCAWRVKWK